MDPYAIPEDLEAIWRPLSAAERIVATARIAQASRKVRGDVPLVDGYTIDQRIELGYLDSSVVTDVVVEMVKRVMAMGDYIRQRSITVDDATKSETFDSGTASGVMFIAPTEMGTLLGRVAQGGHAFEVILARS